MTIQEELAKAKPKMADIAEKLVDMGYTANDFKLVLSNLVLKELEYIEQQHAD
jgi:hypothetical protein